MRTDSAETDDPVHLQLVTLRRNQILDAAEAVFAEKGYHPTTIRDIARHAGIADGTIYNYFESKPALLLGIFERTKSTIMAQNPLPDVAILPLPAFVRLILHHPLMTLKENNFALFRIIVAEMMVNDALRRLYAEQILAPTLAGAEAYMHHQPALQGLSPLEISLTIRSLSAMVLGLSLQYILGDPLLVEQWDRLPDVLADQLLFGLSPRIT